MRLGYVFMISSFLVVCESNKRILLTDATYVQQLEQTVQSLKAGLADLTAKVTALKTGASESGGIYIRWGRRTCPVNTSELVYSGYAGSSWYTDPGAATNYLCLVPDPEHYSNVSITPYVNGPHIYGVEYYVHGQSSIALHDDVPCSVCRSHRTSVVMMPGRKTCYPSWTTEYTGYIVASDRTTNGASQFVCMDVQPESVPHGTDNDAGGFFEVASYQCGSLTCPPYKENEVVACVVCSK